MKQVTLSFSFDEEKLKALKRYMAKKNTAPETEMEDALHKLYEKFVPVQVREYIDENDAAMVPEPKRKRTVKASKVIDEGKEIETDG